MCKHSKTISSVEDVEGFEKLRPEDKQRIQFCLLKYDSSSYSEPPTTDQSIPDQQPQQIFNGAFAIDPAIFSNFANQTAGMPLQTLPPTSWPLNYWQLAQTLPSMQCLGLNVSPADTPVLVSSSNALERPTVASPNAKRPEGTDTDANFNKAVDRWWTEAVWIKGNTTDNNIDKERHPPTGKKRQKQQTEDEEEHHDASSVLPPL